MSNFCLKYIIVFLVFIPVFLLYPVHSYAIRTIDSATLNGTSIVTVEPSATISVSIAVTTTPASNNWQSTSWNVTGVNCIDHANHNATGTFTENFSITAPGADGTYNVSFVAYSNNACTTGASSTYTLTDGIVAVAPTVTPTSTPTPTNTPTPAPTTAPGQPTSTPTPTATPTPTSTTSSSSPTSTPTPTPPSINYPSVVLNPYSPNPTNQASLTYIGKANIEQGTISAVEFSIDASPNWQQAHPTDKSYNSRNENFTFTAQSLSEGEHTILVRAKSSANIYTQESLYEISDVTVITTKPIVLLEPIPQDPTKNQNPTIQGTVTASDLTTISKVEISLDNKKTWFAANLENNAFSFTFKNLEDANYSIVARATDAVANVGESTAQTLIIDTIPPTLGGTMTMFGNQIVTPNPDGAIETVAGVPITILLSLKGGVTAARIINEADSFNLTPVKGTNLWSATLLFKTAGENSLILQAQDGAFNKIEKKLQTIMVKKPGKAYNLTDNRPLENVKVSVYYFDVISKAWVLWDAESFGQKNPFLTASDGAYSFMVPAGRYYIEANLSGFHTLQSQILDFSKTSLIYFDLPLESKPHFSVTLPFIGKLTFSFPPFSSPKTLPVLQVPENLIVQEPIALPTQALQFSLPDKNNNLITLSSLLGKKILLTFLAPWSPHAVDQVSILSKTNRSILANQSIQGIIVQESPTTADIFMRRGQYSFPYLIDTVGKTVSDYNVTILPQHFFIDSKGIIREVISGILEKSVILEKLNQLP